MKITGIELRTVQQHEDADHKDDRYIEAVDDLDQIDHELPLLYAIYLRVQLDSGMNEARWLLDYGTAHEARKSAQELKRQIENFSYDPMALSYDDRIVEDYWADHPLYSAADWRYEVANGDTRQGYWEWVSDREEEATEDNAER